MTVIIIMGIIFAIAVPTWRNVTESRALTSATNQVVADLRKAHTTATNRLTDQTVVFAVDGTTYTETPAGGTTKSRSLPDEAADTEFGSNVTIVFKPDGSATPAGTTTIRVRLVRNENKFEEIEINAATSRVRIVP